ncbi:MAG: PGF-pre-PGF domain-containing protein [Candidatus Hydrothermarchaeaceae archaeon]
MKCLSTFGNRVSSGVIFTIIFFLFGASGAFGFSVTLTSPVNGEVVDVIGVNVSWYFKFNAELPSPDCDLFWNVSVPGPNSSVNWTTMKENIVYTSNSESDESVDHPALSNGTYKWNVICVDGPGHGDSGPPAWGNEDEEGKVTDWTFTIVNSNLPDCGGISDSSSCNLAQDCSWEPYGGFCLLDCFQFDSYNSGNETACNSAYGGNTCTWKPDPWDENRGMCDLYSFKPDFDGASPCFEYDGNKTGCGTLPDTCSWFAEPGCPGGDHCEDVEGGTDHGWCDPKDKFDFSKDYSCWLFDGNKTGCNDIKSEQAWPCEWFPDPWASNDLSGEESGWCDAAFYGGAEGCWDFFDSDSCSNAGDIGCTWDTSGWEPFCREQGCWDFDNFNSSIQGNETCTEFSANVSFISCTWEDTSGGANTTGFCYEAWQPFDCSENDNNTKACFDTFYCTWNEINNKCVDPLSLGEGPGFFGSIGPNPGCFILPTEEKCLEISNSAGERCQWSGGSCIDNSTNIMDQSKGIQCGDINNSAFCSDIPFLSTCCSWNSTNSNNTCVDAQYSTACWDNLQAPPPGQSFCEDWNVTTLSDCDTLASDPWYMPCEWDVNGGECRFAFADMFAGKDIFNIGFDDFSSKSVCEQSGGIWFQEKWTDPFTNNIFMDEWCEMGIGKGYDTCNTSCWACEFQDNGSDWNNGTAMKNACTEAYGPGGDGCIFINDTYAMNNIGWCDVNFTFGNFSAFIFEDCFTPWFDSDGDGLLPDKDPDCTEFFKWGGYIEAETGHECADNIDNDGNGLTDCSDPSCKFDPIYCSGFDVGADTDEPEVKLLSRDIYTDGAFFDIVTNEPTNATILFYYNDSTCDPVNKTRVTDPKLNNTGGEEWQTFDDYDIWHGIPVDNIYLAELGFNGTLQMNKTYFYKTLVQDKAGNSATSKCGNFTTLSEEVNFTVGFKLPPPGADDTQMLGFLGVQFDWDGDGNYDENQFLDTEKKKVNKSKIKKMNIKFTNPNATKKWEIQLIGASFKDRDGSRVLNITDAFIVNDTGTDILVGMKKSKWSEIAQKLGVDYIRIIIPKGSSGLTNVNINHCPDNATAIDQSDCNGVYNESDKTKADCTITATQTICDIPTNIGFSVFGLSGEVVYTPPPSSGGGGPTVKKIVTATTTVTDGKTTAKFTSISKGSTGKVSIPDTANVPFSELAIKVLSRVTNVELTVYKLSEKPADISLDISGKTQSYIQIDESNIKDTDIDSVTISFKVPVGWILGNGIDKSSVVLNRYSLGKWTKLTTKKDSEDKDYVYYNATSPGLSVFGISGQPLAVTTTTTTTTTTFPATTDLTDESLTPAVTTLPPAEESQSPIGRVIISVLAIAIVAGAAYYFSQNKKGDEGPDESSDDAAPPDEPQVGEREPEVTPAEEAEGEPPV